MHYLTSFTLLMHSVVSFPFFHMQTQSAGHSARVSPTANVGSSSSKNDGLKIIASWRIVSHRDVSAYFI
jgi:hypothetical protein